MTVEPFDHTSPGENILAGLYLLLALGLPVTVVVGAIDKLFSARVRGSIARHPILHAVWLLLAIVAACDLAFTLLVSSKG